MSNYILAIPAAVLCGTLTIFFIYNKMAKKIRKLLMDPEKKYSVPLIEKEEISHDTRRFRFGLPSNEHVLGLPVGQHIYLSAKVNKQLVVRPYTPVSSDHVKGYFDLVIKVYFKNVHPKFPDGGKMSQYLESMQIGDTIDVRGPSGLLKYAQRGKFLIQSKKGTEAQKFIYKNLGMICGGTGLTPMFQLIKDILENPQDDSKIWLIYANQTEKDILLRDQLEKFSNENPDRFKLWYTVDKATEGWKFSEGFINSEMIENHLHKPNPETIVLLCGPPPMIKFACDPSLDKLGYPVQNRFVF